MSNLFFYECLTIGERLKIGVRLYMAGDFAKAHYNLLKKQQAKIHKDFCETLEWHEMPDNERSRISLSKTDLAGELKQ